MDQLTERILGIFGNGGADVDKLKEGTTFEDLGLDSLALIEFGIELQRELGVPIEDDELRPEFTLGDVVTLVTDKGATV